MQRWKEFNWDISSSLHVLLLRNEFSLYQMDIYLSTTCNEKTVKLSNMKQVLVSYIIEVLIKEINPTVLQGKTWFIKWILICNAEDVCGE